MPTGPCAINRAAMSSIAGHLSPWVIAGPFLVA